MSKITEQKIDDYLNDQQSLKLKIMKYFKENPNPNYKKVQKFVNSLNINSYIFLDEVYKILGSFFGAGYSVEKNITEEDVDPVQLKMGIKVEMEHTSDPDIAKKISLDHLTELSSYYTYLDIMEKKGKKLEGK